MHLVFSFLLFLSLLFFFKVIHIYSFNGENIIHSLICWPSVCGKMSTKEQKTREQSLWPWDQTALNTLPVYCWNNYQHICSLQRNEATLEPPPQKQTHHAVEETSSSSHTNNGIIETETITAAKMKMGGAGQSVPPSCPRHPPQLCPLTLQNRQEQQLNGEGRLTWALILIP